MRSLHFFLPVCCLILLSSLLDAQSNRLQTSSPSASEKQELFATSLAQQKLTQNSFWHNDYEKVCKLSTIEKKPILIFFNGSDWSGCAMRMKHELLDNVSFQEKIKSQVLCIEIDFPQYTILPEDISKQNEALRARFHVHEIPSLVLLDNDRRIIAQVGYLAENGEQLADDLLRIIEQDHELTTGLNKLDKTPENLKKLYQIAQDLGRCEAVEQILEKGLLSEDAYFLLEKYRLLVERGEMQSPTSLLLRNKILGLETQESHFTLALIDFQQLSQNHSSPDEAVAPLVEYLDLYEDEGSSNIWRVEMMIAQLYMEADVKEKALIYAEKALRSAPEAMHEEIAHSLDYIRAISL